MPPHRANRWNQRESLGFLQRRQHSKIYRPVRVRRYWAKIQSSRSVEPSLRFYSGSSRRTQSCKARLGSLLPSLRRTSCLLGSLRHVPLFHKADDDQQGHLRSCSPFSDSDCLPAENYCLSGSFLPRSNQSADWHNSICTQASFRIRADRRHRHADLQDSPRDFWVYSCIWPVLHTRDSGCERSSTLSFFQCRNSC